MLWTVTFRQGKGDIYLRKSMKIILLISLRTCWKICYIPSHIYKYLLNISLYVLKHFTWFRIQNP